MSSIEETGKEKIYFSIFSNTEDYIRYISCDTGMTRVRNSEEVMGFILGLSFSSGHMRLQCQGLVQRK